MTETAEAPPVAGARTLTEALRRLSEADLARLLALRPELGLGFAFSNSEAAVDAPTPEPVDTSSTDPYIDIGLVIELNVSRELFFGLHARAVYVPFKESARGDHELIGVPLLGSCGMRF